ncbi:RadC family protein [Pseudohongiella spirulinae]|uniref:DNA repair protein RadC n=1 Tax=Pseudohongiella spirulinae TaxID=1249552 RepID=A0A0S2KI33_9GAMM|nr:DNA repair protein RadC [Pseudohongiella spirulinae]ALO47602.1 DNA repair protein RadC [Pseudohongiella spirulinae]
MGIKDWPVSERPREKLLAGGPSSLSDAELLAVFLRTGTRGQTAIDVARRLLLDFGGLSSILAASLEQFCQHQGLGPGKYVQFQAVLELARRYMGERLAEADALTNSDLTRDYLRARLRDYPHEVFACLYLNNQHQVTGMEELFTGTIDGAAVYPREVVKRCLHHNAAAVIFAHNHPSGLAEPSQADISITRRLTTALNTIDVRVLDHVVVGKAEVVSFAERGLL